jgi:superfamily II DNA or RNA helicase
VKFRYDKHKEELILTDATRVEYHQLELWLTRYVKGYKYKPHFKAGVWDGKATYFRSGKVNLGLWKECALAAREIGTSFVVENKEDFPIDRDVTRDKIMEFYKEFFKHHMYKKDGVWTPFFPHDYQIESAYNVLKNRYCMVEVATSGGKSLIISMVMLYILSKVNPDAKFLIIVPSITLVTQFYDNIIEYNQGLNNLLDGAPRTPVVPCDLRIEEVMSERPRKFSGAKSPNVFIGTYQSLEKWPDNFFEQFYMVACDEAHGAKAKTVNSILGRTFGHTHIRFGVSGTFPPDSSCEILSIQSVLGPRVSEVTASELRDQGKITPMDIRSIILDHNHPEWNLRLKAAKKQGVDGKMVYDYEKFYIHASEKRLAFTGNLVSKCKTNTLVLFNTIENGKRIFEKVREDYPGAIVHYIDGEVSNKERELIKKDMEVTDGKVRILVASSGTLSTGVSINAIFNIIFTDSTKSEQIVIQSIGRGLRLHKEKDKVLIFDIVDVFTNPPENILWRHYLERKKFYKKRDYPFKEVWIKLR